LALRERLVPKLTNRNPSYRLHRPSGQAIVTLSGRMYYLGAHGSAASRKEYDRRIAEWLSNGRRAPEPAGGGGEPATGLTVVELIDRYWQHVQSYYRKPDGTPTSEQDTIRQALRPLKRLYSRTPVAEFGPRALKALRHVMITDAGKGRAWCRSFTNKQVSRIRGMFKWGVENELVPGSVYQALAAVPGLKKGRSEARESAPVAPVPDADVAAVLPLVSPEVRAMIDLQLITGMRPGEVCAMRTGDLNTAGKLWLYRPATHKTEHHGHERTVYLGAQAQQILGPYLNPDLAAPLFSPAAAEAKRLADLPAKRKTPMNAGNRPGTNRRRHPARKPGTFYTVAAYRRAIARACDRAFPPPAPLARLEDETLAQWRERLTPEQRGELRQWQRDHRWHPHRLRHSAGTRFRRDYGLEAAQVLLGHKTLTVTQVYAEKNVQAAMKVMSEVG
jgi:integrase